MSCSKPHHSFADTFLPGPSECTCSLENTKLTDFNGNPSTLTIGDENRKLYYLSEVSDLGFPCRYKLVANIRLRRGKPALAAIFFSYGQVTDGVKESRYHETVKIYGVSKTIKLTGELVKNMNMHVIYT